MSDGIIKDVTGLVNALGVKELVQLGTSLTQQGVEAGAKAIAKKSEERGSLVEVAEVYSDSYHVDVEDAKRWLEEDGLRAETVLALPDIAYKDCRESEVVASNFKLGEKVKPGTRIILIYVTAEVIGASRLLFEEFEKLKEEKAAKSKQSRDKAKESVQKGFNSVVATTQKGIGGLLSKIPKKEKSGPGDIDDTD